MAYGKSLEKEEHRPYRVWQGKDGGPLHRKVPKERASKKQRRALRELGGKVKQEVLDAAVSGAPEGAIQAVPAKSVKAPTAPRVKISKGQRRKAREKKRAYEKALEEATKAGQEQ